MKRRIRLAGLVLVVGAVTLAGLVTPAVHADNELKIDDPQAGELEVLAFRVDRAARAQITAVGAEWPRADHMFAAPWLLDAETRDVVWAMDNEITRSVKGSRWLRQIEDDVRLDAGVYELYYYLGHPHKFGYSINGGDYEDFGEFVEDLKRLLSSTDNEEILDDIDGRCEVGLRIDEADLSLLDGAPQIPAAAIGADRTGDDAYVRQGFALERDVRLHVRALGEYTKGSGFVDVSWITDARTRERVWDMEFETTRWAGGADKNRVFDGVVELPAGEYIAYCATDDSHSWEKWNSMPPYDPAMWGLMVRAADKDDRDAIRPYDDDIKDRIIIALDRVRDNELRSRAFRVKGDAAVLIHALGEYDQWGDQMADYAWVFDPNDQRTVWEMTYRDTEHGGGAEKNRLFDGIVSLPEGEYVVYYRSDGSHSYSDWNSSPPYEQAGWGVRLLAVDADDKRNIVLLSRTETPHGRNVLAQLTRIGDDADLREPFTLDKLTRVNVRGIGEGVDGKMYDYGWIENAESGDVVWEMTYRKTRGAGGARKNRLCEQTILLDKGRYVLRFVSDGSHCFRDWNTSPPTDQHAWGITLVRSEGE